MPGKELTIDKKARSITMSGAVIFSQSPNELGATKSRYRPPHVADARPPPRTRCRKRGPRSAAAVQRRPLRGAFPAGGRGEARPFPVDVSQKVAPQEINCCHINIRSLRRNLAELTIRLNDFNPDVVAFTETWLDEATEDIDIPGYRVIARRDRGDGRKGGGVA
eukprot:16451587-Heterocapsa_arctica.AAC.1